MQQTRNTASSVSLKRPLNRLKSDTLVSDVMIN
jgi:hypothetical protein